MILAVAGMLSFSLVGCGSDSDDEPTLQDARDLAGDDTEANDLLDAIDTDTE